MPGIATGFSEREFYLREFRGRTLAVALPGGTAGELPERLLADLAREEARVVLLSPEPALLERSGAKDPLRDDAPRLEGEAWRRLREFPRLGILVADDPFAAGCRELALRLGLFKLVWIDAGGGLCGASGRRLSFVHLDQLRSLLARRGPLAKDPRRALWLEVEALLEAGVPAVNVCALEGLEDELLTYAGSGTLFSRERYVTVRRLGVDDFDAAYDLLLRGVEEGYLAPRTPEEIDAVLAAGFGAFVEGHHLAGIGALLLRPGERCAEIASLYTLTRFLGEGVGTHLVAFALARARELDLDFVFGCTTSERVGAFFERNGLRRVDSEAIPSGKWEGYDAARRARLLCYRAELQPQPAP
jgi:N-acetylglutamate synthase-like GNAT family acetyltransferase